MIELNETETMVLQYLAEKDGSRLVCEPHLTSALRDMAKWNNWALKEFSPSPQDGDRSVMAAISDRGRAALAPHFGG